MAISALLQPIQNVGAAATTAETAMLAQPGIRNGICEPRKVSSAQSYGIGENRHAEESWRSIARKIAIRQNGKLSRTCP
ncbi:MAG: hypothetical protein AAF362_10030 [Pseudomonadota bacterium]